MTLKEKFTVKLPRLRIPSCVKPEDRYDLAFQLEPPKFPRLPTADFALAWYPPYPPWLSVKEDFKVMRQDALKLEKRVVATKHSLYSFKGFLHLDLKHVRMDTPESEGLETMDSLVTSNSILFFEIIFNPRSLYNY